MDIMCKSVALVKWAVRESQDDATIKRKLKTINGVLKRRQYIIEIMQRSKKGTFKAKKKKGMGNNSRNLKDNASQEDKSREQASGPSMGGGVSSRVDNMKRIEFSVTCRKFSQLNKSLVCMYIESIQQGRVLGGFFCLFVFCLFTFSRAAPEAFGGSQARSLIRTIATGLHHGHSNAGSEPRL